VINNGNTYKLIKIEWWKEFKLVHTWCCELVVLGFGFLLGKASVFQLDPPYIICSLTTSQKRPNSILKVPVV
jgi:hypothetical protein